MRSMQRLRRLSLPLTFLVLGCGDTTVLQRVRARIEVTPNPIRLPAIAVGTSTRAAFTVRNLGNDPLTVSAITIEGAPELTLSKTALSVPTNGAETAEIGFAPLDLRVVQGTLVLRSNDPDLPEARIPIIAAPKTGSVLLICVASGDVPIAERCSDRDLSVDLLATPAGGSKTATITLRNVGDAWMSVTVGSLDIASDPSFSLAPVPLPFALEPGQQRSTSVRFSADHPGTARATAVFQANGETRRVELVASTTPKLLCLSPALLDFGRVGVGSVVTSTAHASACGASTIELETAEIVDGQSVFSLARPLRGPIELAPVAGLDLAIAVRFEPTSPGSFQGHLRVHSASGDATIELRGNAGACDLRLEPTQLALAVGGAPGSLFVRNAGAQACQIERIELRNASDTGFAIVSGPAAPLSLGAATTSTIVVAYGGPSGPLGARADLVVRFQADPGVSELSALLAVAPTPVMCASGASGTSWRSTIPPPAPPTPVAPMLSGGGGGALGCLADLSQDTDPAAPNEAISTVAHNGGRWYFEAKTDLVDPQGGLGSANVWASPADTYQLGPVFMSEVSAAGTFTSTIGTISVAADLEAGIAYFYTDGVLSTQSPLLLIPGVGAFHGGGRGGWGQHTRFNFGAEPFAYAPPAGFSAWSGAGPSAGPCRTDPDVRAPAAPVDVLGDSGQPAGGATTFESAVRDPVELIVLGVYDAGSTSSWVWSTDAQGNPIEMTVGPGHNGSALVRLSRGARVYLVLSAYEPTDWQLEVGPTTTLESVALYGMHLQTVRGLPSGVPLEVHTICTGGDGGNCPGFTGENFPIAPHSWPFDVGGGDTQGFINMIEARSCLPLRIFAGAGYGRSFEVR